jgi:hypothetical protein
VLYCGRSSVSTNLSSLLSRILESTGLRIEPYAKWKAMQSKCKKSLKLLRFCPIYFA